MSYARHYKPISGDNNSEESDDEPSESLQYESFVPKQPQDHIDLSDIFFQNLYIYHRQRGLIPILLSKISYLVSSLFAILLTTYLFTCVRWNILYYGPAKTIDDILVTSCFSNITGMNWYIFCIFLIWWFIQAFRNGSHYFAMMQIQDMYTKKLKIKSHQQVTWNELLLIVNQRYSSVVNPVYATNKIMRYENYFIAMLAKDILGFDSYGIFTKIIEWNLLTCFKWVFFDKNDNLKLSATVHRKKGHLVNKLVNTLKIVGVLNLIFAPFVFFGLFIYFIYRYASQYQKNPHAIGVYSFTPLARLKLRGFNELPHIYEKRLNKAYPKMVDFLSQFVNENVNIIAKTISFISGSLLVVLAIISVLDQELLVSPKRPLLFYIGVLGTIFVIAHNFSKEDSIVVYEPEEIFNEITRILHYTPPSWTSMDTEEKRQELSRLIRYKITIYFHEITSVIYGPILFIFWLPNRASQIVDFFRENSVYVDQLGYICSFAAFSNMRSSVRPQPVQQQQQPAPLMRNLMDIRPTPNAPHLATRPVGSIERRGSHLVSESGPSSPNEQHDEIDEEMGKESHFIGNSSLKGKEPFYDTFSDPPPQHDHDSESGIYDNSDITMDSLMQEKMTSSVVNFMSEYPKWES